jgi:hypothetical protein
VKMQFSTTAARSRDMLRRNTAADQPRRSSMGLVNETLRTSFFYKEEEFIIITTHKRASEDGALPRRGPRYTWTCNSVGGGC